MTTPYSPPSLPLDHLTLMGQGDAPALLLADAALDYAGLEAAVGRLAAWLADQCPGPGARVASWTAKNRLACLLPLAAARAGLVHVPINPLLKAPQADHILADSGACLLLTNAARAAGLAGGDYATLDLAEADARADDHPAALAPSAWPAAQLAAILYTSGSTGRPKGVMLSHANMMLGAQSVASYLRISPADRVLAVLPLAFDYGQNQLLSTWHAGGAVAPIDFLTARDVIRAVERHGATSLAGVPPLWVQLVEADWPPPVAASLTRLTNSGGALTPALIAAMQATFPAAEVWPMYGLTEAFRSTYLPPELVAAHPTSMGRAIPHAEILVCRPDGSLCDDDEPGELVHCGPLVAQGYWQDAARTAERFRPAPPAAQHQGMAVWSGDTVRRDAAGLLYFVGRNDAMIKTAGNRVSPGEIEDAVIASGAASEAVAFGTPDARLGAAIILVVRGDGSQDAALRAALRAALPNFMQPRDIVWQRDLPRNANGKLDRVAIAADWQRQAAA